MNALKLELIRQICELEDETISQQLLDIFKLEEQE